MREGSKLIRRNLDSNSSITYILNVFSKKGVSRDPEKILPITQMSCSVDVNTAETASCSTVHVPANFMPVFNTYCEHATQVLHR